MQIIINAKKQKQIKTNLLGLMIMILLCVSIICDSVSVAAATISNPRPKDPNAAVYYEGTSTHYNSNTQSWKAMSGSILYSYKGKLSVRYYKPIFYIGAWVANNGLDLPVTIGTDYSKSVTSAVSATLGVSTTKAKVDLATSVSSSYSKTISYSTSYSMTYTFKMSLYSKNYSYRPALFGDIVKYTTLKTNRITKKESSNGAAYTFDNAHGLYLKLAWK